jgi:hypothetical protein
MQSKSLGKKKGTGVGTNAGVTVTITGASGEALSATGIQCSGDAAALVTVESPASTVIYRKRFAAAFNMSEQWPEGALFGASGSDLLVKISASTSNCEANIQADRIPG